MQVLTIAAGIQATQTFSSDQDRFLVRSEREERAAVLCAAVPPLAVQMQQGLGNWAAG